MNSIRNNSRKIIGGGGQNSGHVYKSMLEAGCCHLEKAISTEREVNAY